MVKESCGRPSTERGKESGVGPIISASDWRRGIDDLRIGMRYQQEGSPSERQHTLIAYSELIKGTWNRNNGGAKLFKTQF
jgi:hypothetical protein